MHSTRVGALGGIVACLALSLAAGSVIGAEKAVAKKSHTHVGHTADCQQCAAGGSADCHKKHGGLLARLHGLCCWPCCLGWLGHGHGDPWTNCSCNGSYKHPVPPQYTYHWPGMYSQQLMTDYHDPYRFPPLKPYYDEPSPGEAQPYPGVVIEDGELYGPAGPPAGSALPRHGTQQPLADDMPPSAGNEERAMPKSQ